MLIPKKAIPDSFTNFRPVSLCNFFNKMLSKLLANRMVDVLPRLIFREQGAVVRGREIADNVLLAQELISCMGKKNRGGNVAIKLHIGESL